MSPKKKQAVRQPPTRDEFADIYRAMVERAAVDGSGQARPMLVMWMDDDSGGRFPLHLLPTNEPPQALEWVAAGIRAAGDHPVWAVFGSEGVGKPAPPGGEHEPAEVRGSYATAFQRGERGDLTEFVTASMRHRNGDAWDFLQPFHRAAGGSVVWDEPIAMPEGATATGRVNDVLRQLVTPAAHN